MTDDVRRPAELPKSLTAATRLDSWKEIGAYLKRDVTTVRRWEKREGLPVHRHLHDRRESVYAYRDELDRWWDERRIHLAGESNGAAPVPLGRREGVAWALTALFLVATAALSIGLMMRSSQERPPDGEQLRFLEFPPIEANFETVALSPDGRRVAFTAASPGGKPMLWVRPLHSLTAVTLPGTENATFPFWSPDGQSIGFFAEASLKRIQRRGRNAADCLRCC